MNTERCACPRGMAHHAINCAEFPGQPRADTPDVVAEIRARIAAAVPVLDVDGNFLGLVGGALDEHYVTSPEKECRCTVCNSMCSVDDPCYCCSPIYLSDVPRLIAEVERLRAQVEAVRALHVSGTKYGLDGVCAECNRNGWDTPTDWPCDTIRALGT